MAAAGPLPAPHHLQNTSSRVPPDFRSPISRLAHSAGLLALRTPWPCLIPGRAWSPRSLCSACPSWGFQAATPCVHFKGHLLNEASPGHLPEIKILLGDCAKSSFTECRSLWLQPQTRVASRFGSWKSEIKTPAGLVSPAACDGRLLPTMSPVVPSTPGGVPGVSVCLGLLFL